MTPKPISRAVDGKLEVVAGERSVVATITTDALDRYNEVILPRGIDLKQYRKNPVVLWAHDSWSPPIGTAEVQLAADGRRMTAKVLFAATPRAEEVWQLYKEGVLRAFSVGLMPEPGGYGPPTPAEVRARPELAECRCMYRKTSMHEFSACSIGVNPEALVTAVSRGLISEELRRSIELPSLAGFRTLGGAVEDLRRAVGDRIDLLRGRV